MQTIDTKDSARDVAVMSSLRSDRVARRQEREMLGMPLEKERP